MIDKDKFYENRKLSRKERKIFFEEIKSKADFPIKQKVAFNGKSFVSGIAVTLIIFFFVQGINSFLSYNENAEYTSTYSEINEAYLSVINKMEKNLDSTEKNKKSISVDDVINSKKEKLNDLDYEIVAFEKESSRMLPTPLSENRLTKLLKMKLSVLEDLIEIEKENRK